jgi:hypothetical protein
VDAIMDHGEPEARRQLELAVAELAVLKQELVLHQLLSTGEPTAEATELLKRLRRVAAQLTGKDTDVPSAADVQDKRAV